MESSRPLFRGFGHPGSDGTDWGKSKRDTRLKGLRDAIAETKGFTLDREDNRTRAETGVSRSAVYRYESVTSDVAGLGRNVLFEAGYRGSADASVKRPIRSLAVTCGLNQEPQVDYGNEIEMCKTERPQDAADLDAR